MNINSMDININSILTALYSVRTEYRRTEILKSQFKVFTLTILNNEYKTMWFSPAIGGYDALSVIPERTR